MEPKQLTQLNKHAHTISFLFLTVILTLFILNLKELFVQESFKKFINPSFTFIFLSLFLSTLIKQTFQVPCLYALGYIIVIKLHSITFDYRLYFFYILFLFSTFILKKLQIVFLILFSIDIYILVYSLVISSDANIHLSPISKSFFLEGSF